MRAVYLFVIAILFSLSSFAQESAELHEAGVPRIVFYQALNFFGLLILMYFLLRKKVAAYFIKRHDDLTLALREATRAKAEAEQKHREYVEKIQALEKDSGKILAQIQREGEEAKQRMIAEAKRLSETINVEAKRSADTVVEKARAELYDDILHQALKGARTTLTTTVVEKDQRRLQKEFVEKIEAVQ